MAEAIKVAPFVQSIVRYLERHDLLDSELIEKLQTHEYCLEHGLTHVPLLKKYDENNPDSQNRDGNGHIRYYSMDSFSVILKGQKFLVSKELYKEEIKHYFKWLRDQFNISPYVPLFEQYYFEDKLDEERLKSSEFYFQKAKDKFDEFVSFKLSDSSQYQKILDDFLNRPDKMVPSEYLKQLPTDSYDYKFLDLCFDLIAYLDPHACEKRKRNKYEDVRTVSHANVYQDMWIKNLLMYKLGERKLDYRVAHFFNFLNDPENFTTVMVKKKRSEMWNLLFTEEFDNNKFDAAFINEFKNKTVVKIGNPKNYSNLILHFIHLPEIQALWNPNDVVEEIEDEEIIEEVEGPVRIDMNLNTIFYGAPGTGKTYFTQQILKQFKGNLNGNVDLSIFENMTLWQVITCALLDMKKHAKVTELIEHPFVASKIKTSINKVPGAGIHGTLQAHTWEKSNTVKYKNKSNPALFDKDEDSKWFIADMESDEVQELIDILKPSKQTAEDRYRFVTFHPNYSYEDFVEGIKPNLGGEDDEQLSYHLENGIFKSICLRAAQDPTHPYCIVIDEINRGNIPAIFGELITLIEEDKRDTLSVTLPYSKTKFTVPKNLYIIGTMNTADRSVEAMDIALRRRFEFKEIKPDSSVVNDCDGIKLKEIFEMINERIEVLLDADHMIGHSYFMKINNLQGVRDLFKFKVIPLLQEYFYNDYEKICLVLGKKFVEQIEVKNIFMKNYEHVDVPTFKYKIVDVDTLQVEDFNSLCQKQ